MAAKNELSLLETLQTIGSNPLASNRAIKQLLPSNQKSKYSANDLSTLINRTYVTKTNTRNLNWSAQTPKGLIQYFQPIHEHIGEVIRNSERFKELGPEISEAAEILVSCILSPNDLQEGKPSFSIDNANYFDADTYNKIIEYLTSFFIDDYKINRKIKNWIHEALFTSGAKVLLTIPERTLASLFKTDEKIESGSENMQKFNKTNLLKSHTDKDTYLKLANDRIFTGNHTSGLESREFKNITEELTFKSDAVLSSLKLEDNFKPAVESFMVKFATEIENGDILHISENPEILRFGKQQKKSAKANMVRAVYGSMMNSVDDQNHMPFISLLNHLDTEDSSKNHPLILDIPTEACIPVCVPGSKEEKLGYFILIDEYGYPLEASKYLCDRNCSCTNNAAASAFSAMYGSSSQYKTQTEKLVYGGSLGSGNFDPQKSTLTGVFDHVLDTMMHHRLKNMGLGHVDVSKFNAISACMLRRFLEKKRTSLLFVPAEFITYLAYDYRDNGTGRSKLESIKVLLSIRATLLVAGMMSATNAAIPHKRIDVTLDEQDADFENTLQTVIEMAILKSNGGLQLGYSDIMSGIIDSHLSVVPKGMAGIAGMELEKSETQNSPNRVDDNLLDFLNKMIVTSLEVPPAALNQTSETEYSRSVATTNIYFSNKIATKQHITCDHISNHCRTIIRNDPIILEGLRQLLNGKNVLDVDDEVAHQDRQSKKQLTELNLENGVIHMEQSDDDIMRKLTYIVDNLRIVLPSPNIAADKSQYEEAQTVINLINQYLDNIYNRELMSKDSELADAFSTMFSALKMNVFKNVAENMGMINSFKFPTFDDIALASDDLVKMYRTVRSFAQTLDQDKQLQTKESENDEVNVDETNAVSTDSTDTTTSSDGWDF